MKKLISSILLFAMISSIFVFPVSAAGPEVTELTGLCPCGCGVTLSDVQWREWDPNTNGDPEPGHYYLADDYVQKEQLTVISGNKVVLDLRGHTLTTDDYHRLFLIYGFLAVLDSVGGGRFSAKTSGAGYGGIVMVSANETNDPTLSCTAVRSPRMRTIRQATEAV